MVQPSPPPPPPLPAVAGAGGKGCQVRCAGCHSVLTVRPGLTEFSCPTCNLAQMLPPELLAPAAGRRPAAPAQGIDPTKMQLPCARCKAILNVPHGLSRFNCPQCGVDLAVDLSKLQALPPVFPSTPPPPIPLPPLPLMPAPPIDLLPEDVNEVALDVEREEEGGGAIGETFQDYRPPKVSIGPPHPDPVVETSSLSAVQPPEPTYHLKLKKYLEKSKALSCLQIETIIYACQRHQQHLPDGSRAGFFIGDGAGVGKGRTIAGLIWENWQHGRQKTMYTSPLVPLRYFPMSGGYLFES